MESQISLTEFEKIALILRGAYPSAGFLADRGAVATWYSALKDVPGEALKKAVQKYITSQKFPPSIAELREYAAAGTDRDGEAEAWSRVRKALCRSTYSAEEEFALLPELIQRAVGSPVILRSWAGMDTGEVETVVKSQFLRAFRELREERRQRLRMPGYLRPGISSAGPGRIAAAAAEAEEPKAAPGGETEPTRDEIMQRCDDVIARIRREARQRRQRERAKSSGNGGS